MKAIETYYKGNRFRSRLEARWAVAFDCLGIAWDYEVEGYVVSGKPYLPDFWLPQLNCFVEIKPTLPTEQFMCSNVLNDMDYPVILICGRPSRETCIAFCGDLSDSGGGVSSRYAWIGSCRLCESPYLILEDEHKREFFLSGDLQSEWNYKCSCGKRSENNSYVNRAFEYAAMCRFEHGEFPKVFRQE